MKKWTWSRISGYLILLLAIAGGGVGYWYWNKLHSDALAAEQADLAAGKTDRTFAVKKGELILGLIQSGTVNAKEKYKLGLEANFGTKLLWVIEENSQVKKGDELARFETENLKTKIDDLKIELENLEKERLLNAESERIQISSDEADLRAAEDRVIQAEDALRKYMRFERNTKRDSLDLAIQNAATKEAEAKEAYNDKQMAILQAGAVDEAETAANNKELRNLEDAWATAQSSLKSAEDNRKVYKRYDQPTQYKNLVNALEQAKLSLEKVRVSNESNLMQKKRQNDNLAVRIKRTANDLERHNEYLTQMVLTAPVDGVVIYGDPDRRWGNDDIKTGMDVYKGQVLMTIPDMGNLQVDFDLPEQSRAKVNVHDKVVITPDSLPHLKFTGVIESIATLPINLIIWDSASPKVYKSKIKLDAQDPVLVNGMSVQVDVVTKVLQDVLYIPVEAVFENKDRFYVYRQQGAGPVEVDVEIGESNENFVEIKSGLNEGDIVYLYRPYQQKQD